MIFLKKFLNYYYLFIFVFFFNEFTLSYFDKTPPLSESSILSIRKIQLIAIILFLYFRYIYFNKELNFINVKILLFIKKISFVLLIIIFCDVILKFVGFGLKKHWFEENEIRYNSPYDVFSNKPNTLDHNELGFRGPKLKENLDKDTISIAFLGGSTGYTGTPPIPELLSKQLNDLNIKNVVYNFSVNSSNHNQHIHRLIKYMNYPYDIVIFYGGNNESLQYLQYDTRPSYPYNYFIKNDLPVYKTFLLRYSSIIGIIENKTGIISGLNKKRKEINLNFESWSTRVVDNYTNTINNAKILFQNSIKTNACDNLLFIPILQPVNPTNDNESKLWEKMRNSIKNNSNFIDYSYIYKDINFFDNVHVDQASRVKISELMTIDLQSIIINNC